MTDDDIPVLTAVVRKTGDPDREPRREIDIAELEFKLTAASVELAERLLGSAFQDLEAAVFDKISTRLKSEMPVMISDLLRDQLDEAND